MSDPGSMGNVFYVTKIFFLNGQIKIILLINSYIIKKLLLWQNCVHSERKLDIVKRRL